MINGSDLLLVVLAVSGIPLPNDRLFDGKNLLPLLTEESAAVRQISYGMDGKGSIKSILTDRWKLVIPDPQKPLPELYDVSVDVGEKKNVAGQNKQVIATMIGLLDEANNCLKKELPLPARSIAFKP